MSIVEAREVLKRERTSLKADLTKVEKALAALEGPEAKHTASNGGGRKAKKGRRKLTRDQAIEKYGAERLTCEVCGFVSTAPQGIAAHKRSNGH